MRKLLVLILVVNLSACNNIKQEASPSVEIDNNGEPFFLGKKIKGT